MKNSNKIIAAAAAGVIAGSVLALLFAPNKGYKKRKKIAKRSGKLMKKLKGNFTPKKTTKAKIKLQNKLQKYPRR